MDFQDFFNKDKRMVRIKIQGAQVGGVLDAPPDEDPYEPPVHDEAHAYDYAEECKAEENAIALEHALIQQEGDLHRPDSPTTLAVTSVEADAAIADSCNIYGKYKFDRHVKNNSLSINSHREEILQLVDSSSVTIIQGPTGCGKTTQVPQFILDYCQSHTNFCKIAITQPRRIAAISVARRVCEERGWPLGSVVGYQVGLDNQTTEDTLLTYMTTGVLLQKLVVNKSLNTFTHIIVDEVHERDAEMDFLLLVIKKFLRTVSHHVKIILMSATFNVEHFSKYFETAKGPDIIRAPVLDVTKKRPYTVNTYYLNQFLQILEPPTEPHFDEPCIFPGLYPAVIKLLRIFDTFEVNHAKHGSVLVFLPGIYEIEEMYELLKKENDSNSNIKWFIVPLHSSITIEEQRKAFTEATPGHRKIILSTNIAESSITVPDVVYVIDFCLTKILINDPTTNYSSLKLSWASHTNCTQRSGRVGRVAAGRVYRLVTEKFYHQYMSPEIEPEMLRTPLQRLVLLTKMLGLESPPYKVLGSAIDAPALHNIKQTICLLKEAGALMLTRNGAYSEHDGDLTCMGRIMAQLPLDIYVSKLIILGYLFSTLKECVIMGAAISLQNIFSSPFNQRMKAYQSKLSWADCSSSDLIAYLHVYVVWERNKYNNLFQRQGGEKLWMKRNFLQPRVMKEWRILVTEIKTRLARLGITEPIQGGEGNLTEHEKAMMLKVVISGAFYPHYFVRSSEGGQIDESGAVRLLGGRDPYTTVYMIGKAEKQPVELYVSSIRELLKDCGQNMHISHDNTSKIYIQFKHDMVPNVTGRSKNIALIPGKIAIEVYNAVKYRHCKLPTTIKCISAEEAQLRVKEWKKSQQVNKKISKDVMNITNTIVPGYEIEYIQIRVSYANNPGHFFAHTVDNPQIMQLLNSIEKDLNSEEALEAVTGGVLVSHLYAAPFEGKYYRARIVCVVPGQTLDTCKYQVIFIDYGNIACVMKKDLKTLHSKLIEIPPLALECVLTGIQPSHEMHIHALWSDKATTEFIRLTSYGPLFGKVYSVVDNVVSLELYSKTSTNRTSMEQLKTINSLFIEAGYAQPAIESFLSQDNHNKREHAQRDQNGTEMYTSKIEWYDKSNEMPAPENGRFSMTLRGPFSPLEMNVYSIVQSSVNKQVSVEWNSVNAVLLDADPQDPHDRLLVAASVSQSISQERLSLRHTTMMPNIHGFPVLMALLFCPKADFHTNPEGTRLTSILCGLGAHPEEKKKSLFPAHDIALNLDFELTNHDILKINELRYFMNTAINAIHLINDEVEPPMTIGDCQTEIRKIVRSILKTKRKDMPRDVLQSLYTWGKLPANVQVVLPMYIEGNDIWSLHQSLNLADGAKLEVRQHLKTLSDYAKRASSLTEITCKLCNIVLYDVGEAQLHLVSDTHTDKLKGFNQQ